MKLVEGQEIIKYLNVEYTPKNTRLNCILVSRSRPLGLAGFGLVMMTAMRMIGRTKCLWSLSVPSDVGPTARAGVTNSCANNHQGNRRGNHQGNHRIIIRAIIEIIIRAIIKIIIRAIIGIIIRAII